MKKLRNIAIITLLAMVVKSDITILAWFVITTWQGLKLVIK
jgi:hypothetical protein